MRVHEPSAWESCSVATDSGVPGGWATCMTRADAQSQEGSGHLFTSFPEPTSACLKHEALRIEEYQSALLQSENGFLR